MRFGLAQAAVVATARFSAQDTKCPEVLGAEMRASGADRFDFEGGKTIAVKLPGR